MKTNLKLIVAGVSGMFLSACGGSGGDDAPAALTFAQLAAEEDTLRTATDALTIVDPMELPINGGATYNGTLGFVLDDGGSDEVQLLGDMAMLVNFVGNDVGGRVDNFFDSNEESYSGSLDIANGFIDRTTDPSAEYTFDANLIGTLINGGDQFISVADIRGEFMGSADTGPDTHVRGIVEGAFDKNGVDLVIAGEGMTPTDNVFFGTR